MSERAYRPGVAGHGSMNEQPGGMSGALSVTAHHMKNARRRTTGTSSRKMTPSTHVPQAGGWRKQRVGAGFGFGDDWWGNASPWIWGRVDLCSTIGWAWGGAGGIATSSTQGLMHQPLSICALTFLRTSDASSSRIPAIFASSFTHFCMYFTLFFMFFSL